MFYFLVLVSLSVPSMTSIEQITFEGKSYPLVKLDYEIKTSTTLEVPFDDQGSVQFNESKLELANFRCRMTINQKNYIRNLEAGDATLVYSFEQKCPYKQATGQLTNLSNAWLGLVLVDNSGNIVEGPSRWITANPKNGKCHWVVVNQSSDSSRGDGYIKTKDVR